MSASRPIVVIEDDVDDLNIIKTAIEALHVDNPVVVFTNSGGVIPYFTETVEHPILVISDVNLPRLSGVELYKQLAAAPEFASKRIPYVFLSTSPEYAKMASEISGCGYFVKPRNYFDYVSIVQRIVLYWIKAEQSDRS